MDSDPLWYKDAIIYEAHVRAFYDSDEDGFGDFQGLREKLPYLQDLGVTVIWLLPFYPSPWKDDGYDIADYTDVHPAYGTLNDARQFVREAHRRGMRVVTELVCNHTSDQHPWFQRARRAAPGTPERDFYVWSDTPDRYREARIIFKDFETSNWAWDPMAGAYYWHRFYSHQPDLNFDNPQVRQAIFKAMGFWLRMGVDGLRLDAVPYLYEREGTNGENLPETHAFLKQLRRRVDRRFKDRMLLAEANQWPEDAVAYFGDGDECHMAFHFPVMPRLFMGIQMEDRFPVVDIMAQTPQIPDNCQWAIFLRNHDELTLEMVTDEERDYMYRVYAHDAQARINLGIRRRLAPLLSNNRRRIELMNGLLFSLPGTPVIYYGDEIGMGDNIYLGDRDGVRTPMQWSADRNAGFSKASRQRLYLPVITEAEYHYEAVNVEAQQRNPQSLLWWMKRLISLRKQYRAFGRGTLEFLHPDNRKVLAFIRRYEDQQILVVANLSRFAQYVELDLTEYRGLVPTEMFGRVEFPPIGDLPYLLSLGPHAFFWFLLEPQPAGVEVPSPEAQRHALRTLTVSGSWDRILRDEAAISLGEVLPDYLRGRAWWDSQPERIRSAQLVDAVPLQSQGETVHLGLVQGTDALGESATYVLPLAFARGEEAGELLMHQPGAIVSRLRVRGKGGEGVIYDGLLDPGFRLALLNTAAAGRPIRGLRGQLRGWSSATLREMIEPARSEMDSGVIASDSSRQQVRTGRTVVTYGEQAILRLFHKLEGGVDPGLEMARFLTERGFPYTPSVLGAIQYYPRPREPMTLAILEEYVPNQGNAWDYTVDFLSRFFENALATSSEEGAPSTPYASARILLELVGTAPPAQAQDMFGSYLAWATRLGQLTADMHLALVADPGDALFGPEPFTTLYQRSVYQSMRNLASRVFLSLRRRQRREDQEDGLSQVEEDALQGESLVFERLRSLMGHRIRSIRIRCHENYALRQILLTSSDLMVTNFASDPTRPIGERRIKRSPIRDVASMLISFYSAAYAVLLGKAGTGAMRTYDFTVLAPWGRFWLLWSGAAFLEGYLSVGKQTPLAPEKPESLLTLLDTFLLDAAITQLGRNMDVRPDWTKISLLTLLDIMEAAG